MACTALVGLAPLRLSARRASSADTRSAKLVVRAAATERANEDGKKIARASLAALAVRLPPRGPSPFRHALASRARAACARREHRAMRLAPGDQFPRVPRGLWTRSAGSYPRPPRLTTSTPPPPPSPPPPPAAFQASPAALYSQFSLAAESDPSAAFASAATDLAFELAASDPLDPETARQVAGVLGPFFSVATVMFIIRIVMTWYPSVPVSRPPWVFAYLPTEPLLKPTRALVPPVGGVDVSPIIWVGMISFMNEILLGKQGLLILLSNKQIM